MHMTATLTKWYDEHGRHEIFAGGKNVPLSSKEHHLVLDPEAVAKGLQHDLDDKGIAKNAREETIRARDQQLHNQQMADLYRKVVLKEEPTIQIQGLKSNKKQEVQPVLHKPQV
jgi:hypothetical protein